MAALGFWQRLSPEGQVYLAVLVVFTLVCGLGALIMLRLYVQRKRSMAWQKAMRHWSQNTKSGWTPTFRSASQLAPRELERFAGQVYARMGYRVIHTGRTGDHGVDVKLVNPDGQVELVQCKQWNRPVGEPELRDLFGAMGHERAVRGFIWAPGGFSDAARRWARGKPIVLADSREIGRLVESAYQS
jgi:HJR/Mrr/RecB family endonuclease